MSDAMITRRGGGGSSKLQSKTVVPAATASIVSPDSGYDGLSSVTVAAITPQKEAEIYIPGTQDQIIAADRWLAGAQTISGDANLVAANIKKGVSIFNVTGSYEAVLDTNNAILKVVTSAGCSVTVTNGTDRFTQQDADGFVRYGYPAVTEHFFVIPAAAFGTFGAVVNHPIYGQSAKANAVVVGEAGKVYEILCGGKNILLNSTYGRQSGFGFDMEGSGKREYDADLKEYTCTSSSPSAVTFTSAASYDITAFDSFSISGIASASGINRINIFLTDKDGTDVSVYRNSSASLYDDDVVASLSFTDQLRAKSPYKIKIVLNTVGTYITMRDVYFS